MNTLLIIEILATGANLFYIVLLIRERILCWPFGILGSLLSIYLFVDTKLYSEAILYSYYVGMGIWGWLSWHRREAEDNNPIISFNLLQNTAVIAIATSAGLLVGYGFDTWSDAQRPYVDAMTTMFSFAATYMQVRKVLQSWMYWLVINLVSVWLYQDRALDVYAVLIGVYAILSAVGFVQWFRAYRGQGHQA